MEKSAAKSSEVVGGEAEEKGDVEKEKKKVRKGKGKKIASVELEAGMEFQQIVGVSPQKKSDGLKPRQRQSPRLLEKVRQGPDLMDLTNTIKSAHRTLDCEY